MCSSDLALTGLTVAAYTINDGYAVRILGVPPLLFDWLGIAGRALLLVPFVLLARGELVQTVQRSWRTIAIVALLSPAAYILALQAMTLAPVSRVAPARELSMLVATLFGARLLGEPDMWRRLAGAALIASGVAALSQINRIIFFLKSLELIRFKLAISRDFIPQPQKTHPASTAPILLAIFRSDFIPKVHYFTVISREIYVPN